MRSRIPNDEELDITPMIDVTFLMLIFFMVASTMQAKPDLPIPPAKAGAGVDESQAVVFTLLATESGPTLQVTTDQGEVGIEMSEVAGRATQAVQQQRTNVVLKADRDLPAGFVEQVAKEANVEGVESMFYGVREPE